MKPVTTFFRSLPFWRMDPNFTIFNIKSADMFAVTLAEPSRQFNVVYLCIHHTGKQISDETAKIRLPNGLYHISFIDPVTLATINTVELRSTNPGQLYNLHLPNFTDDLAVRIENIGLIKKTIIKGTE